MPNLTEKTLHTERKYTGKIISVDLLDIELPDGRKAKREAFAGGQFANRRDGRGSSPLDRFKGLSPVTPKVLMLLGTYGKLHSGCYLTSPVALSNIANNTVCALTFSTAGASYTCRAT